jgi:hypothetical protein
VRAGEVHQHIGAQKMNKEILWVLMKGRSGERRETCPVDKGLYEGTLSCQGCVHGLTSVLAVAMPPL